jgi:hypothetical protein
MPHRRVDLGDRGVPAEVVADEHAGDLAGRDRAQDLPGNPLPPHRRNHGDWSWPGPEGWFLRGVLVLLRRCAAGRLGREILAEPLFRALVGLAPEPGLSDRDVLRVSDAEPAEHVPDGAGIRAGEVFIPDHQRVDAASREVVAPALIPHGEVSLDARDRRRVETHGGLFLPRTLVELPPLA